LRVSENRLLELIEFALQVSEETAVEQFGNVMN
jgi:hypothetical protein